MGSTMDKGEIKRLFTGHIHCSQIVAGQWAEYLDMDPETVRRMAAPFGGGCFDGQICGCVAGALLVIGAEYGHCEPGDTEGNERLISKTKAFTDRFKERFGTLLCKVLVGYDFSVPGQREEAAGSGVFLVKCPEYVNGALEILDEIMTD